MTHEKIVVVGAGIAGLSAAMRIAEKGRQVTVVDPKVDYTTPLPMDIRHTIPTVGEATMTRLNLPTMGCPLLIAIHYRDEVRHVLQGAYSIDELSVRKSLLQTVSKHPYIELVKGKAVDLQTTQRSRGRKRVNGVTIQTRLDGKEVHERIIETGEDGLVIVASGRGTTVFSKELISEQYYPSANMTSLGAHITSPALRDLPRDTVRRGVGILAPTEQIIEDGTDFATFFEVSKTILNAARGGREKVLTVMQLLVQGTSWQNFFEDAIIDRVLYYTHTYDVFRNPTVDGLALVGDASVYLDPKKDNNGLQGFERIDKDTDLLSVLIASTRNLDEAITIYSVEKEQQQRALVRW